MLCGWLVLGGCATFHGTQSQSSARLSARDFYPLDVGTSWSYEVNLLSATRTIDVVIERKGPGGFVTDSTGAQLMADAYGVRDKKRYILRNPIQLGTKWTNVVSVSSVERYEIIAVGQPCSAPAGTWKDCVVVRSRNRVKKGEVLVNTLTFAPGIGIVRVSTVLEAHHGKRIPQSTLALTQLKTPTQ